MRKTIARPCAILSSFAPSNITHALKRWHPQRATCCKIKDFRLHISRFAGSLCRSLGLLYSLLKALYVCLPTFWSFLYTKQTVVLPTSPCAMRLRRLLLRQLNIASKRRSQEPANHMAEAPPRCRSRPCRASNTTSRLARVTSNIYTWLWFRIWFKNGVSFFLRTPRTGVGPSITDITAC